VSHDTEDPTDLPGSSAEPTQEPAIEESLDAWGESTTEQTWTPIDVDAENPGASAVDPAPQAEPAATESAPATQEAPEPKLSPWQSIAAEQASASRPAPARVEPAKHNPYASVAESDAAAAAKAGDSKRPSSLRAALDERLASVPRRPLSPPPPLTGKSPQASAAGSSDTVAQGDAGPSGPSLPERLYTLTNERPEVGLGIAFVGGLLLATIIKRFGRR
jgi:hypothetical protein